MTLTDQVTHAAAEAADTVRHGAEGAGDAVADLFERRPLTVLAAAAGGGILLGLILRRSLASASQGLPSTEDLGRKFKDMGRDMGRRFRRGADEAEEQVEETARSAGSLWDRVKRKTGEAVERNVSRPPFNFMDLVTGLGGLALSLAAESLRSKR